MAVVKAINHYDPYVGVFTFLGRKSADLITSADMVAVLLCNVTQTFATLAMSGVFGQLLRLVWQSLESCI